MINETAQKISPSNKSQQNCSPVLTIKDIKRFYQNNNKQNNIGLEYERISLDKNTLNCADYQTVSKIIEIFANQNNWQILYDKKTIIGAKSKDTTSISLEPGCQLEISLAPKKNILDIDLSLNKIINNLDKIASCYGVIFLGYGINPKNSIEEIALLNKKRYLIMDEYLPNAQGGLLAKYMMRKTAGIQINIDYTDEQDAFYKVKFLNLIMPFIEALCSNSPFENNTLYDKKSLRANIWRYVGKQRCNVFYKEILKNNNSKNFFEKYIQEVLKVPMIYIERNDEQISLNGRLNFAQFMKNLQNNAHYKDYILHQSLCFPDIRLKNYIEIRNHDSAKPENALALCAFYKGLMKENIKELIEKFNFLKIDDIELYNINSINNAMNYKLNDKTHAVEIIEELFNISAKNLSATDKIYLNPLLNMIKSGKTNSDIIIDYNISKVEDLVEFIN